MQRSGVLPAPSVVPAVEGQAKRARSPTNDEQILEAVERHERQVAKASAANTRLAQARRAFEEATEDARLAAENGDAEPQSAQLRRLQRGFDKTERLYQALSAKHVTGEHRMKFVLRAVEHLLEWKRCVIQAALPGYPAGPRTAPFQGDGKVNFAATHYRHPAPRTPVKANGSRRNASPGGTGSGTAASASSPSPQRRRDVYGKP